MALILTFLGFSLVIVGIINGAFSVIVKSILRKKGDIKKYEMARISDFKKLKNYINEDKQIKVIYQTYLISSILFLAIIIAIIACVIIYIVFT